MCGGDAIENPDGFLSRMGEKQFLEWLAAYRLGLVADPRIDADRMQGLLTLIANRIEILLAAWSKRDPNLIEPGEGFAAARSPLRPVTKPTGRSADEHIAYMKAHFGSE